MISKEELQRKIDELEALQKETQEICMRFSVKLDYYKRLAKL